MSDFIVFGRKRIIQHNDLNNAKKEVETIISCKLVCVCVCAVAFYLCFECVSWFCVGNLMELFAIHIHVYTAAIKNYFEAKVRTTCLQSAL